MAKSACPVPPGETNYNNQGTSWKYMIWISLASLATTTAIALSLIVLHLRRYRAPKEQRQIIRIIFSVIAYSLVAFVELWQYETSQYVDPLGDIYEAFGLCALFLLFIQYVIPGGNSDDATLQAVREAEETTTKFDWPKVSWVFVFQYPVIEILCVALQEVTEATNRYCANSLSPQFAHLWVELIESISIGACVISIWKFNTRMKSLMKVKRGLSKLLCFKVIVFIRFAQQWVFSLLLSYHVIKTSPEYSYNDILWGISATATCVEMVLFSAGFWYAFSSTEYSSDAKPHVQRLPVWRAILDAINPMDIVIGIFKVIPFCIDLKRRGEWTNYRVAAKEEGVQGAVRKGIRKYKARKAGKDGRYQELDEGMEQLTMPQESHPSPDFGRHSMSGGMGPAEMYQPPEGSPPGEANSYLMGDMYAQGRARSTSEAGYLMADSAPGRRSRASSQSSLMVESEQPEAGQRYQRYHRSRSPSASGGPTQEKDMV